MTCIQLGYFLTKKQANIPAYLLNWLEKWANFYGYWLVFYANLIEYWPIFQANFASCKSCYILS